MAQATYTPISLYHSTTAAAVPTAGNLVAGELALNTVDEKLYFKNSAGTVKLLASNATSAPVLTFSAGTTGFTPSSATSGAVTLAGTLATTNGGTGLTAFTANQVFYASSTSAFAQSANLTFNGTTLTANTIGAFTLSGTIAGGGNQINNVIIGTTTPLAGAFTTVTASTPIGTASGGTGLGGATPFTSGGVVYASSSSVLATGSALTYDGTILINAQAAGNNQTSLVIIRNSTSGTAAGSAMYWGNDASLFNSVITKFSSAHTSKPSYFEINNVDNAPLTFAVNNTEQLRLTSTSLYTASGINVGIGNSNPLYKLHAVKTGGGIVGRFDNADGVADIYGYGLEITRSIAYIKSSGALHLGSAAGYSAVVLDSAGNLGLGVTPSAWLSGTQALQIGSGSAIWNPGSATQTWVMANSYYDQTDSRFEFIGSGTAGAYAIVGNTHQWNISTGTTGSNNPTTFSQAMTLDNNGRLGIGTTSVGARLDISYAGGTSSNTTLGLKIGADVGDNTSRTVNTRKFATIGGANYSNSVYNIGMISCDSDSTFSTLLIGGGSSGIYDATSIKFITATTTTSLAGLERLVITDAGNIGIGISIPTTLLDLAKSSTSGTDISMPNLFVRNTSATQGNGSSTFNQVVIGASAGNGTVSGGIRATYDTAGPYGTGMQLYVNSTNPLQFFTNNAERMRITSAGNVGIGTSSPNNNLEVYSTSNPSIALTSTSAVLYCYYGMTAGTVGAQLYTFGQSYSAINPAGSTVLSNDTYGVILNASNATGILRFQTNATERFRIGAAGQFGIGGATYGTAGQVLTSGGSAAAPTWANAGKVLQVVQGTYATQVTTTSTTYVTTNITASITPTLSSSKILIIVAFPGDNAPGSTDEGGDFTIYRDSTDLLTRNGDTYYNNGGLNIGMSVSMNYLDSPATTSSTAYTVYMRARDGSATIKSCHNNSTGTIILMEVAA